MKFQKIYSRPKPNTLFSVMAFLVLAYGLLIYNTYSSISDGEISILQGVVYLVLGPIAVGITLKVTLSYKYLTLTKESLEAYYPFRFQRKTLFWSVLSSWQEIVIETNKQKFLHLEMKFRPGGKIAISFQENTSYKQVLSFLEKNYPNKKQLAKAAG